MPSLTLWDLASFTPVTDLRGHESYVMTLTFSPDGTQLASGSGDGTVRIWDSVPQRIRRAHVREAVLAGNEPSSP